MGRYSGTLANLVEEAMGAGKSHKGGKPSSHATAMWSKVLTYLENHSTQDGAIERPEFESPLPPFSVPSEILDEQLLERKFGPRQDNTLLKLAATCAPAHIVAALCHLQPHAARIPDHREKLPLHVACRRSPTDPDTLKIFHILLAVYEEGLAHRDTAGRTPLHCLFMYNHAPARSLEVVQLFCQEVPAQLIANLHQPDGEGHKEDLHPLPEVPNPSNPKDKVPSNAAIIPDAKHGALPLHYAVMEGASREVLKFLLQVYPDSKRLVDRKGRTALAWYLGAGHDEDGRLVTGEPNDPGVTSWWDKHKLESATVQLLLNSKSARMADASGRSPLHWAVATLARHYYHHPHKNGAPCVSRKTIQFLLDHHVGALVTGDLENKTPLHCFFDAVRDVQAGEWKRMQRNKAHRYHQQPDLDLVHGGPTGGFSPPVELLEVLINSPEANMDGDRSAVFMEDKDGRLPIHAAMEVASSAEIIQLLIKAHPTSLVHTTEETLLSPLHAAVMSPYVAPLQTAESMRLILRAYVASRHGTYVDGRLALKMEDADGNYPIHYACRNQVCLEVLKMFVEEYPKCALFPTADGELPLHCLLDSKHVFEASSDGTPPVGSSLARSKAWESPEEERFHQQQLSVLQRKIHLLVDSLLASNRAAQLLSVASFEHGLLPLHMAVAWGAVPYQTIYRMVQKYPQSAQTYTTAKGHAYSPLQLHDRFHKDVLSDMTSGSEAKEEYEWQSIRELLFSYSTMLDGHRHLDDLMSQCVRSVRSEVCKGTSYHKTMAAKLRTLPDVPAIETTDTFTSVEVPNIDHGGRPLTKKAIERSRHVSPKKGRRDRRKAKAEPSKSKKTVSSPKKSIYDDDAVEVGYEISSDGSVGDGDDEEEYFSGPEEAEEYMSDESDRRFDTFDDDNDDPTMSTTEGSWITKTESSSQNNKDASKHAGNDSRFQEEKKDDMDQHCTDASFRRDSSKGPCLSDVSMRLLTFMILYCDPKTPRDNYAQHVENIFDDVSRVVVEQIVSLPLQEYAAQYLEESDAAKLKVLTLRDAASPKCRELIHKMFYFLGRFDFHSDSGGILLNRSTDGTTVVVKATEWTIATEEYNEAPELEPGEVEAQVWQTGVLPPDEAGYMGAAFQAKRRNVCFVFTKNALAYEKEVRYRKDLGVVTKGGSLSSTHIVPLIAHFNANGLDRRTDRMYKNDTNNESFVMLDIFGGNSKMSSDKSICLAEYPFAFVYPYSNYGDLYDYFFRHGIAGLDETREVCCQIGKSLSSMHQQGIVHGNVSMKNIILFPPVDDIEDGRKHWALSNLSSAYLLKDRNTYMGPISSQGLAEFSTSALPPEMFVKLTSSELKEYKDYWDAVEKTFMITVDRSVVDPVVDFQSGTSYVVRCHFVPNEADVEVADDKLPPLPYKLLPAREYSDIWAFGQLLFMLCSSGRQLFPTNARTGHLLGYKDVCLWDMQAAESMVYEYVDHALAQDILLRLLSPYEKRAALSMDTVLNHPFFKVQDTSSSIVQSIVEKRRHASEAYRRWQENNVCEKSEEGWLKERTVPISCWDFDFQTRIHLTPTALIPEMLARPVDDLGMPCSFVVLPYKLVRNKRGVLTPPSKRDVERAERLGLKMLSLSKACHFVLRMKQVVLEEGSAVRWTTTALWPCMKLPHKEFSELQSRMTSLAAEHVENFRRDPVSVGLKLIQENVQGFLDCYDDSSKCLLYLVDEYYGVPVAGASAAPFPHQVQASASREVIQRALPFMYLCARYFRGVSGSASGLVKLIFEAAAPHIPPSWSTVCKGLDCSLDRDAIVGDVQILCEAMCDMYDTRYSVAIDDDFEYMQNYILEMDIQRRFAKLQRVSSGEASVWTSSTGVEAIRAAARKCGFSEAISMKQKTDLKMREQEARIKELEKELDKLRFRKGLGLDVPEVESLETIPPPTSIEGYGSDVGASSQEAFEMASKCIAANSDLMGVAGTTVEDIIHDSTIQPEEMVVDEVIADDDVTEKEVTADDAAPEEELIADDDVPEEPVQNDEALMEQSVNAAPAPSTRPFSEIADEFLEITNKQDWKKPTETATSGSPVAPVIASSPRVVGPSPSSRAAGSRLVDILKNVTVSKNPKNSELSIDTAPGAPGSKEWDDLLTPE